MLRIFQNTLIVFIFSFCGLAQAEERWQVLPEKSKVIFFARTTLHDFNGKAQQLSGGLVGDTNAIKGFVDLQIAGLSTGDPDRDKNMYQMFNMSLFPQIHFAFDHGDITKVLTNQDAEVIFSGVMSMHHTSRQVSLISTGNWQDGVLLFEGTMFVHLKDFGLKPPSILGLIRVSDEVKVQYKIAFIKKG